MNIKIKVINALTNQVEIDSQIDVTSDYDTIKNNHNVFRGAFPDCNVNFFMDDNSFICSPALNMERDEEAYDQGRMTWNEYVTKWYKGCPAMCNEEDRDGISDQEIESQIDQLIEEDFLSRDAVCY